MNTPTHALETYLARTAAIHWGHVGDLGRLETALDDLLAIFDGQAN